MSITYLFPNNIRDDARIMVFIDGENFACRFNYWKSAHKVKPNYLIPYKNGVYLWSKTLDKACFLKKVIRKSLFTSVQGDDLKIKTTIRELKKAGIEDPRVFKREKERGSKMVDISMATEMMQHATRKNMDVAVLIAGDEDYVPLVEAVKREGCKVLVWFLHNGLSPHLVAASDYFHDLGGVFLADSQEKNYL